MFNLYDSILFIFYLYNMYLMCVRMHPYALKVTQDLNQHVLMMLPLEAATENY